MPYLLFHKFFIWQVYALLPDPFAMTTENIND